MVNHPNRSKRGSQTLERAVAFSNHGEELLAACKALLADIEAAIHAVTTPAFPDRNIALEMIRDAVEELGPVAACSVSRDQFGPPRPTDDAEAIIAGIHKIINRARHETAIPLLTAIREARRRLAKGRPLWNGPCHECDAVLVAALPAETELPVEG
jgi:hypothetical protein